MRKILISNDVPFHYDVIESAIAKYDYLLRINKLDDDQIDLYLVSDQTSISPGLNSGQLVNYLRKTYNVNVVDKSEPQNYDYVIHCTAVASGAPLTDGNIRPAQIDKSKKFAYIAHDVTNELLEFENVFFLSDFARSEIPKSRVLIIDKLPSVIKTHNMEPVFVSMGSFVRKKYDNTRDYSIIEEILSVDYGRDDFRIHLIGNWNGDKFKIWDFIDSSKIHRSNWKKINYTINADWIKFNVICASADYIMPLVSRENQPDRFFSKVTSSIFYSRGYGVRMFADKDFAETYSLGEELHFPYERSSIHKYFREAIRSAKRR